MGVVEVKVLIIMLLKKNLYCALFAIINNSQFLDSMEKKKIRITFKFSLSMSIAQKNVVF